MQKRQTRLPVLAGLLFGLVGLALLAACIAPGPVPPPVAPPLYVVGTVTAQAIPVVATQTALVASLTQVAQTQATLTAQAAQSQATLTAQAEAQGAVATGTAQVESAAGQVATATAIARAVAMQGATATSLAAANATALAKSATPLASATPAAGPTTVAVTATATRTPVPPTLEPVPTQALASASTRPCVGVDAALAPIIARTPAAGIDPGCATGPAVTVDGALQEFYAIKANVPASTAPRSLMIWRGDTQDIYLVQGQDARISQGSLSSFKDRYRESDPEIAPICAAMEAPPGYEPPVRGFGLIWCADHLSETIGWPNHRESAASVRLQPTRNGLLMKVISTDTGAGYLVALDFSAGRAVTTAATP